MMEQRIFQLGERYMPCFTETRMEVDFKVRNFDLLEDAVKSLDYTVERGSDHISFYADHGRITIRDGSIDVDERDRHLINKLKQRYSREVIKTVTKRYGWALHETSKNKFLARKRSN
jgi:hypothetical protein